MANVCLERLPYRRDISPSILLIYSNGKDITSYNSLFPPLITLVNIQRVALPKVKFNESMYLVCLSYTKHRKVITLGNRITKAYIWSNEIQCINYNTYIGNQKHIRSTIKKRILHLSLFDNSVFTVPKLSFRYLSVECNDRVRQPIIKESILTIIMPMHCLYKNTYLAKSVRQMGRDDIRGRLNTRIYNLHRGLTELSKSTRKYNRRVTNSYSQ